MDPQIRDSLLDLLRVNDERALNALRLMIEYEPFRTAAVDIHMDDLIKGAAFINHMYGDGPLFEEENDEYENIHEMTSRMCLEREWRQYRGEGTLVDTLVCVMMWCNVSSFDTECVYTLLHGHRSFVDLFAAMVNHILLTDEMRQDMINWLYELLNDDYEREPLQLPEADFSRLLGLMAGDQRRRRFKLKQVQAWLEQWIAARPEDVGRLLQEWNPYIDATYESPHMPYLCLEGSVAAAILAHYIPLWKQDPEMARVVYERHSVPLWMKPLLLHAPLKNHMAVYWDIMACETPCVRALENKIRVRPPLAKRVAIIRAALARRRWRVAFRAVWGGGVMWRLYQRWSLHPDRLVIGSSALATVTASTRAAMSGYGSRTRPRPQSSVAPLPPVFTLTSVAAYFQK